MPDPSGDSPPPQTLIELYSGTHYDIRLPGGQRCTVRIGEPCPAPLDEFFGHATNAFLISAGNPRSVPLSAAENRQRMHQLLLEAKSMNQPCLPGSGHIPGHPWRESFLFLPDLQTLTADDIASRFEQNAVVHLRRDRSASLRIYRANWRPDVSCSAHIEWAPELPARQGTANAGSVD